MSAEPEKKVIPFGGWSSKLDSNQLINGNCKNICELQVSADGTPFWIEQVFVSGKRLVFQYNSANPKQPVKWTGEKLNVRNAVHEYGGGSFCLGDSNSIFICFDGGIYELSGAGKDPRPIILNAQQGSSLRHADLFFKRPYVYSVQEIHCKSNTMPENRLVRIDCNTGHPEVVAEGADFYASPRVSPDGRWLAWIQWNHPYMPWDLTSVRLMRLSSDDQKMGVVSAVSILQDASYFGLQWASGDGTGSGPSLYLLGDPSGFWNVFRYDPEQGKLTNVISIDSDIGDALWTLGNDRPFTVISPSQIAFHSEDSLFIKSFSNERSTLKRVDSLKEFGFTEFNQIYCSSGKLFAIATGPKRPTSVVCLSLEKLNIEIIREARNSDELHSINLSVGQLKKFISDGVSVEGYFYAPTSDEYEAPKGELPPAVLFAHAGPTGKTTNSLNMKIQYFTSRGWAIFDINYRGSTGRGKAFRDMLLGNWGIVDRNDMINGAKFLVDNGLVESKKLCIVGSSAGGFLAFSTLIDPRNPFTAAVALYGVADLEDMCKSAHKFEYHYSTNRLIAPYPEQMHVYHERSFYHNIEKNRTPIAFIHGAEDPVVPCKESQVCYERLKSAGIPTALKLFPGEGHGFKTAESITKSLEITYCFLCQMVGIVPSVECCGDIKIDNFD